MDATVNPAVRQGQGIFSRYRRVDTITKLTVIAATVIALIYILLPIFWMLKSSFQTAAEIKQLPPKWVPDHIRLDSYQDINLLIPIWRYIFNSIYVSAAAALLATLIGTSAAYVLSRFRFPGMTLILVTILVTQLIPPITRVFPLYALIQDAGLLNTYTGLILSYAGFSLPFSILLLKGYFESSCPPEIEEAALVDGCSYISTFLRIILPISLPGLAAVTIFTFLNAWNDFLWASLLLNSSEMKTIQVGIGDLTAEGGGTRYVSMFMAACVLATVPALIMFIFVQRWLVSGLTSGSVK
ncbi:Maltose/maltodextrin ABC transporter, permease protein MalG (plasmid) [Marinovum algicola DG 898]|nr:Maltose/maltodextrin ABC transporter, permease protein MalG [Marinovum algicola DG 898]